MLDKAYFYRASIHSRQVLLIAVFALVFLAPQFSVAQSERGAERRAERAAERAAEREAERQVERQMERQMERQVERQAEKQVERQVERQVEKQVGRQVAGQVQKQVQKQVQRQVGNQIEKQAESQVGNRVENNDFAPPGLQKAAVDQAHNQFENDPPTPPGKALGLRKNGAGSDEKLTGLERAAEVRSEKGRANDKNQQSSNTKPTSRDEKRQENARRYHDIVREPDGAYRLRDQWLVMTDSRTAAALEGRGLKILNMTRLEGMDQVLVEFEGTPADLPEDIQLSRADLEGDFNHLYQYQAASTAMVVEDTDAWIPHDAFPIENSDLETMAIGLIDSQVNLDHDAVAMAKIRSRSFIEEGLVAPVDHGTAIASILVGASDGYTGLLPQGELYAASVFYETPELGQAASVKSLLLALDWMVQSGIKVINMSLSGPGNVILQRALKSTAEKGVVIVAAAGNGGPAAPPAYPAAYEGVIAVTAVNRKMDAYYRANRGGYIDISAPGVNILHADNHGHYKSSSGTSYAVPFVAAAFACLLASHSGNDAVDLLLQNALDLGESGVDDIYGSGLVQLPVASASL